MKADFSTTGLINIQVASRLSDLLFDELEKINIDGAPLSAQRIHLKALNAPAPSKKRPPARNPGRHYMAPGSRSSRRL